VFKVRSRGLKISLLPPLTTETKLRFSIVRPKLDSLLIAPERRDRALMRFERFTQIEV
jgi:hypothetical protein